MKNQFETDRSFETVSRHFIDVVEQHAYQESGSARDVLKEGTWAVNIHLPLLPIRLNRVEFGVRAQLDDSGVHHTPGRNYDIEFRGNNDFVASISFYAPYEDRPNGYFQVYDTGIDHAYEIEPSDVELILGDILQLESAGKLYREVNPDL